MNIIIIVILIIAVCGAVGISADIVKNKKNKASLEKILTDIGVDVVNLIQNAISVLTMNISHFKDVNEFTTALSDKVSDSIIDALKKEGKYDESILSKNNLSSLTNYILTKYKDEVKINEVFDNAKKAAVIDEPVTTTTAEVQAEAKAKETSSNEIPEEIQAEFTETKAPTTVEEAKADLASTPNVSASITPAININTDNSSDENPLVAKEEEAPETTNISKDLNTITSDVPVGTNTDTLNEVKSSDLTNSSEQTDTTTDSKDK